MSKAPVILLAVAIAAAVGGYFLAMRLVPAPTPERIGPVAIEPEDLVGQPRPDFSLLDRSGSPVSAGDFDGGPWLLNFWATWCQPCVEEMPMLNDFHGDQGPQGVQVVGIAVDDPDQARSFADQLGIDYTLLFGQSGAMVAGRAFGNRSGMLPYSVLVDAGGRIRWIRLGAVQRHELEREAGRLP